jgi:hypothetical protein
MAFVLTKLDEVVDVDIELDGEIVSIKVGAIPHEIGVKLRTLLIPSLEYSRAIEAGDKEKMIELLPKTTEAQEESHKLLCKYGIRSHSGLEYADGSPVPCILETEKATGHPILSEETLKIYFANKQFVSMACGDIQQLQAIGLGKYKKGGFKTLKEAQEAEKAPLVLSSGE